MWRNNLTMCNTMSTKKLPRECWILGSDTQSPLLMREIIACQVPQISAGAYINPGFRDCHHKAAASKSQVALQYDDIVVIFVFVILFIRSTTMLGQDIVTGNAECSIAVLHQQWDISGTLKDHFQIWHTTHTCQVLAWIVAAYFHSAFSEKSQCC